MSWYVYVDEFAYCECSNVLQRGATRRQAITDFFFSEGARQVHVMSELQD